MQTLNIDEAKFSPGPWKACKGGDCPCGAIWNSTGEIHLATAFDETAAGMDCFGSEAGVSRAERIANARLIAASPDLLQALQDLILVLPQIVSIDLEEAVMARAAISKALGHE